MLAPCLAWEQGCFSNFVTVKCKEEDNVHAMKTEMVERTPKESVKGIMTRKTLVTLPFYCLAEYSLSFDCFISHLP